MGLLMLDVQQGLLCKFMSFTRAAHAQCMGICKGGKQELMMKWREKT